MFIAALAALIGFLYFRTGKQRSKGNDGGGAFFSFDNDSGGDCGGDGGGGGD
ncbi:MAG: hypothetical protein KKE21_13805 [Gammaproteobacteria bacterium]|nr:hypothetical protein [Gammaproteobacteria bacterium]MBU1893973.1 hypothetical protein [Gammaproteobacteria bacterium]